MKKIINTISLFAVMLFSAYSFAGGECFKEPENYNKDRAAEIKQKYKEADAGPKELLFCNLQLAYEGPHTLFKNCGCRTAIKKSCSFNWDKGVLKPSGKNGATAAMCAPWLPIAPLL